MPWPVGPQQNPQPERDNAIDCYVPPVVELGGNRRDQANDSHRGKKRGEQQPPCQSASKGIRDDYQPNKNSKNTTDEVKVKTSPEPESKRISHFHHSDEREDPAGEYCGADSRCTHDEKSDGAQSHD